MELGSSYVLDEESGEDLFDEAKLYTADAEETGSGSGSGDLSDEEVEVSKPLPLRKVRKADTNIVSINLGKLAESVEVFTGEITVCQQCSAIFTPLSKLSGYRLWNCEFCGCANKVELEEDEVPSSGEVDYLLEPPSAALGSLHDDDCIIFCIDISGSMCCTSEVTGGFKIVTDKALEESLRQFIEMAPGGVMADQYFPNQRNDISYVSRLQCVQAAVSDQIEKMAKENPNKKVAIITFSNEVTIHLPGGITHVISGDHLYDYDYLLSVSEQLGILLSDTVKDKEQELLSTLLGLTESGATALGPALLVATGIAGKKRGSSVILCTDGIANVGVGTLDGDPSIGSAFYKKATQTALELGVVVSVLSIKGENARLEFLAKVAADTRGFNDILDPLNLTKGFNFILENKIVATDVSVTFLLHKTLKFRHEKADESAGVPTVKRQVGNCNANSVITFEYGKVKNADLSSLTAIPFQIQIKYTRPSDSCKCMRVIAKEAKVTKDRQEAEAHINVAVIGLHSAYQTSKLATRGEYTKARMKQKSNMRMVRRAMQSKPVTEVDRVQYKAWNTEATKINKVIKESKALERKEGVFHHSAEADSSDSGEEYGDDDDAFFCDEEEEVKEEKEPKEEKVVEHKKEKKAAKLVLRQARKQDRGQNDHMSNVLYQAQNPFYSAYCQQDESSGSS